MDILSGCILGILVKLSINMLRKTICLSLTVRPEKVLLKFNNGCQIFLLKFLKLINFSDVSMRR